MQSSLGTSPPVLPIHRQPSPLSFSVSSHSRADSPPPSPDGRSHRRSVAASSRSSVALPLPPGVEIISSEASAPSRARPYIAKSGEDLVPVQPLQDSILYRSTVAQLESSCGMLKKLSKGVHHASSALELALEAVEKAEDDLLYAIGEMTRWLEVGYGIPATDLWGDAGVRAVRKRKWRVQRDEVAAMVSQGAANVKSELKRHGLAGAGAQAKFEKATKHYYDQTGAYLSTSDTPASKNSASTRSHTVDSEQAARTAQFDLARYSHHSTLLYAVPPSSISCLDLLVNLYGWTGGILSEHGAYGYTGSLTSESVEGQHAMGRSLTPPDMREDISVSLARLAGLRVDLLDRWDMRNDQTNRLEAATGAGAGQNAGRASMDAPSSARESAQSPTSLLQTTPVSSSGIEHREAHHRKHRIHRIQKSMGGRLRDLLGSGSSSRDLASLEKGSKRTGDSSNRNSFDVSVLARPGAIGAEKPAGGRIMEEDHQGAGIDGTKSSPLPALEAHSMPTRPIFPSRRSMNLSPTDIPFLVDSSLFPLALPSEAAGASQDLRSSVSSHASSVAPTPAATAMTREEEAGLGLGLPSRAGGRHAPVVMPDLLQRQDVEELDEVGRKKEGVLWGGGTWEEVGRHGKTKWEKYWVVLDHSSIYEYRDTDFDRPETAHATIDLKFASVREGRGTDRRFVFEIVTPTQGRRLYQATSDLEMKQWIHSISNAIESSINGTSSVRTFDTSKIRTLSGSYDDHALPIRQRLGFPVPGIRPSGSTSAFGSSTSGMPLPTIPASPQGRRSVPPPLRIDDMSQGPHSISPPLFAEPRRRRTTSFKKALRQSAEIASQWKDGLVPRSPSFVSDPTRPPFLGVGKRQNSASSGVSSSGVSHANYTAGVGYDRASSASREREREDEALRRITEDGNTVIATPITATETGNHTPTLADKSFGSWIDVDDHQARSGNENGDGGHDGEIEKRVMEMAGLGLGASPSSAHRLASDRRVKSDSRTRQEKGGMMESSMSHAYLGPPTTLVGGEGMTRSRSAEVTPTSASPSGSDYRGTTSRGSNGEVLDMETLRRTAGMKENAVCADCGKSTRQSRWASICLRERPMVIFICIKCCGIHRSFGTHISKPRSVDLDIWTPESIALALEWGNVKANAIWEYRSDDVPRHVPDENMVAFLNAKYVEGRYLSDEDRSRFGLAPLPVTRFSEGWSG